MVNNACVERKLPMFLSELLFPPRCPVCEEVLPFGSHGICGSCVGKLSFVEEPVCMRCGKELDEGDLWSAPEYCMDCRLHERSYAGGVALINYTDSAKELISRLKYHNRRDHAVFLAEEMAKRHGQAIRSLQPTALIPVPIHRKKRRERGFNQAELLAWSLGKRLRIPVESGILLRTTYTKAQKQLGYEERQKNERKAFKMADVEALKQYRMRHHLAGEHLGRLCLVDDIYTTGATAEACTRTLLEAGAEEVYLISMAIGCGRT